MTKRLSILWLTFFVLNCTFAQRATVDISPEPPFRQLQENTDLYEIKQIPITDATPFLSVSVTWISDIKMTADQNFKIGFGDIDGQWTWHVLTEDAHSERTGKRYVSNLIFADASAVEFGLSLQNPEQEVFPFEQITVHFFNPIETKQQPTLVQMLGSRDACVCSIPEFLDREGWCPSGDCPEDATPAYTDVTHLIIHHTASSNTANDWGAVVRSIWDFHVNTNGWDDVGYNWLIDPTGVLYQGRGDNVRGAHFCGQNTGTMGVAMLGNFEIASATEAAKNTLKELLAWKTCDINTDPVGTTFHTASNMNLMNISGHRDGCSTVCPGELFYPEIPVIREEVVTIRANDCDAKLDAPTIVGEPITETQIDLSWNDDTEESGFVLERSVGNNSDFMVLATLPANTTTYQDLTVGSDMVYFYRIQAISDDLINSDYSNEVMVSTDFSAVNNYFLNNKTVQIFPNPNNGNFQLNINNELRGDIQISILDLTGKMIFASDSWQKSTTNANFAIALDKILAGTYYVKIRQMEQLGLFKLVIF